ncbi:hypothetical protein GCM10027442_10290 [Emticicia fontis]
MFKQNPPYRERGLILMKFLASIDVMPIKEILDPQGKAVLLGLKNLDIQGFSDCRIGKHINMEIEAADKATAESIVEDACKKLLANLIMEEYTFELTAI